MKMEKVEDRPEFRRTIYIEGLGTITSTGNFNVEGWIKSLLKSKYVTGKEVNTNEERGKR